MPIGTLIKNSQCQLAEVTSHPPSVGPTAGATMAAIPHMAMARPWRSRGNNSRMIAIPTGTMAPPQPLEDPEEDEESETWCSCCCRGGSGESGQRAHEHGAAPDPVGQPAGDRLRCGHRQQIGGHDPFDPCPSV